MGGSIFARGSRAAVLVLVLIQLTVSMTVMPVAHSSNVTTESKPTSNTARPSAASTKNSTTAPEPAAPTTMRVPSEQEINEARKIIQEVAGTMKESSSPKNATTASGLDFTHEALELRLAEGATKLGLNFIKNLSADAQGNTVVSPVSLQILLNIILLGAERPSATETELLKLFGYDSAYLPSDAPGDNADRVNRVWPHSTMNNLLDSLTDATHQTPEKQRQQHLLNSNQQLAAHLQTASRDASGSPASQLNFTLANLMLTDQDRIKIDANYESSLRAFYNIKLELFSKSKPAQNQSCERPLHERINSWVLNSTQNQIGELVKESDLDGDDLVMVLLNAAHFKGRWLHTFNSKMTHERLFYNEGQKTEGQEVKFMRQSGVFGYAEFGSAQLLAGEAPTGQQTSTSDETVLTEDLTSGRANEKAAESAAPPVIELSKEEAKHFELTSNLNCSVLMMPFALNEGQELSMVILLPAKRDGLADLLASLSAPVLNEIYRSMNEQQVQVELPKFGFESALDAKSVLQKIGVTKIFSDGAQLGPMISKESPGNAVRVDKIVHKAKIVVDEEGAEAAAASAATIVLRNLIRPLNPTFVADHPFVFVIRHNRSNLPLFMGTVRKL